MKRQKRDRYEGRRTAHKSACNKCRRLVIVIRHPADALKSARELPTAKVRLFATHLEDAGQDFCEAATTQAEFQNLLSQMICEKRIKPWEVAA